VALKAGAAAVLTRAWTDTGPDPILSGDPVDGAVVLLSPDPAAALTRLAAAWRTRFAGRVIGVTGSNGKTTTKDLLACLLGAAGPVLATRGNLNNELGLPLTLLGLRSAHARAVIEMGASRPGDIARLAALAAPHVGVITNASPAHLEGFGSLDAIVRTKGELLDELPRDGLAVLNADSPGYAAWAERAPCPVVSCGEAAGEHRWRWSPSATGGGRLELDGESFELPLPGRHNGANLALAVLAARAVAGSTLDMAAALEHFGGSPHRGVVLRLGEAVFLDDAYNANPASLLASAHTLATLPGTGRRIAVLGAMAELGPESAVLHRRSGAALHDEAGLDLLLAVGEAAADLAEGFAAAGGEAVTATDHRTAAVRLCTLLRPGDRVLVKGSRSAAMETVLEHVRRRLAGSLDDLED
jgi:UDP-N-acetylmuramoyl-tripeptide--D-alanyl-D-alanine ligase